VYGDSNLWWVIADANDVEDEYFDDLPAGVILRIPDAPTGT
jgi:nucleoid-associated protein YgaU